MNDATLNALHAEFESVMSDRYEGVPLDKEQMSKDLPDNWNAACDRLKERFLSEGLEQSASFIEKYRVTK